MTEPRPTSEPIQPPTDRRHPAYFIYDSPHGGAYYFAPEGRQDPPYDQQRETTAILDIAADGTLAGVELVLGQLPPPPHCDSLAGQQLPAPQSRGAESEPTEPSAEAHERPTGRELRLVNAAISLLTLLNHQLLPPGIALTDAAVMKLDDLRESVELYRDRESRTPCG